jgi:hypothetical protein
MNESKLPAANLIVFGIGHSGTTILTRIIHTLGWNAGDTDRDYAESVSVRAVNERALRGRFDQQKAARALAALRRRWAIKDPGFVHALHQWQDMFGPYEPTLIWIVRDLDAVARSYERGDWVRCKSRARHPSRFGQGLPVPDAGLGL